MFVHSVYFWLKEGLSENEVQEFQKGLRSLLEIKSLKAGHIGTPAATDRPVIDTSYSFGLVTLFDDLAGHDQYQVDPIHDAFRDNCAKYWSQVRIYDFQDKAA